MNLPGWPYLLPERLGCLGVGRVYQHDPGVQRQHRPSGLDHAQPPQCRLALWRVAGIKAERDVIAGQQVADLMDPGRAIVPEYRDRLAPPALLAPPLIQ